MFVIWTILVTFIDVKAIGPLGSEVGFATVNGFVHQLVGVNMALYTLTDMLGLVPLSVVLGFGTFGLVQWIKKKDIRKVDIDILVLGGFYVVVLTAFVLFEMFAVNYRPVLIGGVLEASYPSSTTLLSMCVMPTFAMQMNKRIKNAFVRKGVVSVTYVFTAFMVTGRLFSGVHWFSDIVGGALFSMGVVIMYHYILTILREK